MKAIFLNVSLWTVLLIAACATAEAESHRATRLGNPATRFAPPVKTPEELRSRFRDPRLQPDFAAVLKQWGWQGDIGDMFRAAEHAQISDITIPVGSTMPFMSSREKGRAICLRNVLWAGKEPAPAYAFNFSSAGRRYRCVTPKACSNFFLEDLGPEPKSALAVDCAAPAEVLAGRTVEVCLTIRQTGNMTEPKATVALTIPPEAEVRQTSGGAALVDGAVSWDVYNVAPNEPRRLCAVVARREPGPLSFSSTVGGTASKTVEAACMTKVVGIPAILLEVVDLADPVEVGQEVTYKIEVTNQGSATGTNIRLVCTLPESQEYVSGEGVTTLHADNRKLTTDALPTLDPKAVASWSVKTKVLRADDARFKVELSSDQFAAPITEDESTRQY